LHKGYMIGIENERVDRCHLWFKAISLDHETGLYRICCKFWDLNDEDSVYRPGHEFEEVTKVVEAGRKLRLNIGGKA